MVTSHTPQVRLIISFRYRYKFHLLRAQERKNDNVIFKTIKLHMKTTMRAAF